MGLTVRQASPNTERSSHTDLLTLHLQQQTFRHIQSIRKYDHLPTPPPLRLQLSSSSLLLFTKEHSDGVPGVKRSRDELEGRAGVLSHSCPASGARWIGDEIGEERFEGEGVRESDGEFRRGVYLRRQTVSIVEMERTDE